MENENYESYDDDFDTDYESGVPENDSDHEDSLLSGESEIDQVARLLAGEDIDTSGAQPKRNRELGSVAIGSDGKRDFSSQSDTPVAEPKQGSNENQTIYSQQVREAQQTAASEWEGAHKENERLNDLFASGQLSAEDHYRLTHEQGVRASQAKELMMTARIRELEHEQQKASVIQSLADLGDEFSPERIDDTFRSIVDHAKSKGISEEVLAGVENRQELEFLYNAMQNEKKLQAAEMELKAARAMLRKQSKQLKGRREKQTRDASVGVKNRDTLDQVMEILAGADAPKGGRR